MLYYIEYTFTYNDEGIITSKNNGNHTTNYYLDGNKIIAEVTGGTILFYLYDCSGSVIGMKYRSSSYDAGEWDVFWFEKNMLGDVIAVYDDTGTKLVTYSYDAWGACIASYNNSGVENNSPVALNPFRYRGYYYDEDLGLYYLGSRYYDPITRRFINSDGYVSTGQGLTGYNMFAYCGNNPVNRIDTTGDSWLVIVGLALIGGYILTNFTSSEKREATTEQISHAIDAANRAELEKRTSLDSNKSTIDIKINTQDVIDSVDEIAYDYYYERLYERTVEMANTYEMPTDNLMSVDHIRWEFQLHAFAHLLGHPSAAQTDLNVEETPWKMFERAIGW